MRRILRLMLIDFVKLKGCTVVGLLLTFFMDLLHLGRLCPLYTGHREERQEETEMMGRRVPSK